MFLYSCGTVSTEPHTLPFGAFDFDKSVKELAWVHLFGLFWWAAFLAASSSFIVIGATCFWYFAERRDGQMTDEEKDKSNRVCRSLGMFIKNHMGTVAFGSLLVAICDFLRFVLELFD